MALNLSTLTNASTSGDVLAEALTTADFLEGVPVLRNLARGSQKGGDAKQGTALNQPKALPLDANGKGYCYLPVTTGNAPAVTFPTIGASADFVLEMDVYIVNPSSFYLVSGASYPHRFLIDANRFYFQDGTPLLSSALVAGASTIKIERSSGTITLRQDGSLKASGSDSGSYDFTHLSFNGQFSTSGPPLNGYIQKATLSIGGTEQLNIDFTATNIRHGDTKFKCATGQVVTVNQAGNDPATVIKKSVLRFDGVNDGLRGLFANNINGGYMFAAFSVLGTGGSGNDNRVFSVNANGAGDVASSGFVYGLKYGGSPWLAAYGAGAYSWAHVDMYDDARGDILYETKAKSGGLISKVNNANKFQPTTTLAIASNEFNVGNGISFDRPAAIDLEFLALFPSSITDDQADDVRNYINNRNNVFSLIDSQGYYFFDAQKAPAIPITSGSSSWNGRIVGSDFGDANKYATQSTSNDSPVGNGYTVTFADNTDHLDIPSTTQAGWQIVGTSLGTFVYRVDNDAVTELNLLGNFGNASVRRAGDLYGVMLLPLTASSADIESAKRLLIDRGAAESATASNYYASWYGRVDIVEFGQADTSNITAIGYAWFGCNNMTKFPPLDLSSCVDLDSAWRFASSLSSFPAGAKLGTSASNVNFTAAWRSSGLTSFPALDLSTGNRFNNAWEGCSALTSFPAGAKLGTEATNVNFESAWRSSGLISFPALDLSTASNIKNAFRQNTSLVSFEKVIFEKSNNFFAAWYADTSLVNFAEGCFDSWNPDSLTSGLFDATWNDCDSLSAISVENILVSLDASGQYATSTGASGGSALGDAGIDIDYNVSTGTPAYSTLASLKSKGWVVIVNGVTL